MNLAVWPIARGRVAVKRAQTILVVTDRALYPARAGNRARIIALLRGLCALGFRVALVVRRPPRWRSRIRTRLLAHRVYFVSGPAFSGGSPRTFDSSPYWRAVERATRLEHPAVVIAEYLWMAPCLDRVGSGPLKMLDTLDLMHVRRDIYGGVGSGAWVDCSAEEEATLLRKADAIIAIQRSEMANFAALVPERKVICLPHMLPVRDRSRGRGRNDPGIVMFVGSSNQGNVAGVRAFLHEGWPLIQRDCPGAELRIYGDSAREVDCAMPGVRTIGYVRRLGTAYQSADVVINPVMRGTGLKIKTVEALASGKAVVTTPCGADGLERGAGSAFVMASDMRQLATEVVALLQEPERRRLLERRALEFARQEFAPSEVFREFLTFAGHRLLPPTLG
jgi:hypothetical protein